MRKINLLLLLVCLILFTGCMAVKEYEKVYLNDPDMILSDKKCDRNLLTAQSYREAASGANGGKTGGGCGCN
jgi:hypothetical protein